MLYTLSAIAQNADDLYSKGQNYYFQKDYSNAKYYFELAASHGNTAAFWRLAEMYCRGRGVKQDLDVAEQYIIKAQKQGNSMALNEAINETYNEIKNARKKMIASGHIVQSQNDITKSFFNTNKIYYIEAYVNAINGLTNTYKKGESSIIINNNSITKKDGQNCKDKYASLLSKRFLDEMKDCVILRRNEEEIQNMYTLDNKDAIQAIMMPNGKIIVVYYAYNYKLNKYLLFEYFLLYSD